MKVLWCGCDFHVPSGFAGVGWEGRRAERGPGASLSLTEERSGICLRPDAMMHAFLSYTRVQGGEHGNRIIVNSTTVAVTVAGPPTAECRVERQTNRPNRGETTAPLTVVTTD